MRRVPNAERLVSIYIYLVASGGDVGELGGGGNEQLVPDQELFCGRPPGALLREQCSRFIAS